MVAVALPLAGVALSKMTVAIQALYGMGVEINAFIDKHIDEMKASDNPTISRTGRIMEMAKYGFGIGYVSSVAVIAVGQLLLGNSLAAATTVVSAAVLSNPIAMTCAAIGAIYYGWSALSDVEREEILDKVSKGIDIGMELIKSLVNFVIDKSKSLLSSENLDEIKKFVGSTASAFGRTLGDVTKKFADVAGDAFNSAREKSAEVADKAATIAKDTFDSVTEAGTKVSETTRNAMDLNGDGKVDMEDFKIAMRMKSKAPQTPT